MRALSFLTITGFSLVAAACGGGGSNNTTTGSGGHGGTAATTTTGTGGDTPTSTSSTGTTTSSSSTSSTSSGSGGAPAGGKWVGGYYAGYQQAMYPPEAIDWNGLSHLMVGAVQPKADGTLDTTFYIDAVNGPALAKKLVGLAHQHGKKAIAMIGGAGLHAGFVGAASSAHRAAFVQNLVQLAADYGFDGFDLDWEPLETADYADFKALAEALRAASPNTILTVPVGWVNANFPDVDAYYGEIAPIFDQINIMSYSMAGPWDGWQSWHSSALMGNGPTTPSSVDASVKAFLAAGVPAAKLGIGIGFYGSCWTSPVSAPGQDRGASQLVADDNVMTFDHIMTSYHAAANYHYDTAAHAPYLGFGSPHGPEGCTFVSYEDEQSIADKGTYVKDNGLGGAIVWTINEGYRPDQPVGQRDPLMEALGKAFLQ